MKTVSGVFTMDLQIEGLSLDDKSLDFEELYIREDIKNLLPYGYISFIDTSNSFVDSNPIVGGESLKIKYGTSEEDADVSEFRIVYPEIDQHHRLKIWFIKQTKDFLFPIKSRGFFKKTPDQIAKIIGKEIGAKEVVTETFQPQQSWIQPQWSNADMLLYLSKHCTSVESSTGGSIVFLDRFDRLIFKGLETSFRRPSKFTLTFSDDSSNIQDPEKFFGYKIENFSEITNRMGGYGTNFYYFDYVSGEFKNEVASLNTVNHRLQSDYSTVKFSDIQPSISLIGGRTDTEVKLQHVKGVKESAFLESFLSGFRMNLMVLGRPLKSTAFSISDRVKLNIPYGASDSNTEVVNDSYSGDWFIEAIEHVANRSMYINKLTVLREGVNSVKSLQLSKSSR